MIYANGDTKSKKLDVFLLQCKTLNKDPVTRTFMSEFAFTSDPKNIVSGA